MILTSPAPPWRQQQQQVQQRRATRRTLVWSIALAPLLPSRGVHAAIFGAPKVMHTHGPFEIVIESRSVSAGGFPNTSGNPFATREVASWRVRHQGRDVAVSHGGHRVDRFWNVWALPGAPRPALLVAITNAYLIHDDGARLVVQPLDPEPNSNLPRLQWLDARGGQPDELLHHGIKPAEGAGADHRLQGGRFLRSRYAVLDVHTLRLHPYSDFVPRTREAGQPMAGLNANGAPALALSPQRTHFVALGSDDRNQPGLVVVDFIGGGVQGVAVDRQRMRLRDGRDATPAWLQHHFDWQHDAAGRDRLTPRERYAPWPWQGRLLAHGGEHVEYRIGPIGEAGLAGIRDWLVRSHGGQWVADPTPSSAGAVTLWQPPGTALRLHVSWYRNEVMVYEAKDLRAPYSATAAEWVRRVGAALDAELRGGRHGEWFVER